MTRRPPTRDLDALAITHNPPGARKEKIKERSKPTVPLSHEHDHLQHVVDVLAERHREPAPPPPPKIRPKPKGRPYAELRAASAFSFLAGSSLPEDLVAHAMEQGLPAMALIDINGVYGAPRFYGAAKKEGLKALVGAEIVLEAGRDPGA